MAVALLRLLVTRLNNGWAGEHLRRLKWSQDRTTARLGKHQQGQRVILIIF